MPRKKRVEEEEELELKPEAGNDEEGEESDLDETEVALKDDDEPEVEPSDDDLKSMKDLEEFDDIIEKRSTGKGRKATNADEYDEDDLEGFDDFSEDEEDFGTESFEEDF